MNLAKGSGHGFDLNLAGRRPAVSRKMIIAVILGVALIAFEIFNFDTTQYALTNLLGEVQFAGILWASILAIAFCAIDFAGLVRLFTPQRGSAEPRAVWFLTGAWFLGTFANAIMTWWAVSLTLLNHEFGNEVLSREALLRWVPIFVAALVWLTRILFIGAFSVAGEEVLDMSREQRPRPVKGRSAAGGSSGSLPAGNAVAAPQPQPVRAAAPERRAQPAPAPTAPRRPSPAPAPKAQPVTYEPLDEPVVSNRNEPQRPSAPKTNGYGPDMATSRIRQRPPAPGRPTGAPSAGTYPPRPSAHQR